jgi:Ca2+-binding EF-hand superfamily protein
MRRFLTSMFVALCMLGLAYSPASAQDKPKGPTEEMFKKLDTNADGKLSEEEFVGKKTGEKADKAKEAFKKKDKDSDGFLSLEEFLPKKK